MFHEDKVRISSIVIAFLHVAPMGLFKFVFLIFYRHFAPMELIIRFNSLRKLKFADTKTSVNRRLA